MATIHVDGKTYEAEKGQNLLHALQTLGVDLPYFCWHPAMGSVGACRQCAIIQYKDKEDKQGRLVMACMVPVEDDMYISVEDRKAVDFRARVIEWLMTSHPHDCPVCDEGGECHLQDMTVMTGHNYRRYRFKKRTFRNQNLGPFIYHEMNRCITCYRCVRFYHDYAGGNDLVAAGVHNGVYFGRNEDGKLENEFSGNLVEVCPTGVFTDKTLRHHYARKWDLQSSPSICHHCGIGCNIFTGTRYGKVVRILNRYNYHVNGYFNCDRGRFGYGFVNSEKRVSKASLKIGDKREEVPRADAVKRAAQYISGAKGVIGIGSPRASLESNYALKKMVGDENYYSGLSAYDNKMLGQIYTILKSGAVHSASLKDIEQADAVLILGEDLTQSAPMAALAVRQAVRNKPAEKAKKINVHRWNDAAVRELVQDEQGPLFIVNPVSTKLDHIATEVMFSEPDDIARTGFAVASLLSDKASKVDDLNGELQEKVKAIADALKDAEKPIVISGMGMKSDAVIQAAANVAMALGENGKKPQVFYTVPECNHLGLASLGGNDLENASERIEKGEVDAAVIIENDLYYRIDRDSADKFFDRLENVIVCDYLSNETFQNAGVLIPTSPFSEAAGSLINNEGRFQTFYRALEPDEGVSEGWRIIYDLMAELEKDVGWERLEDLHEDMFDSVDIFKGKEIPIPSAAYRILGVMQVARSPHRYSGRTAMKANINIHEQKPPGDPDSPLSFSMEGFHGDPPSVLNPYYWAPGWNSVQSLNRYQKEIGQELRGGDPGVRLFEYDEKTTIEFFKTVPERFKRTEDEYLAVPVYHIFGSDALSNNTDVMAELIPAPYVIISESDAKKAGIDKDSMVKAKSENIELSLKAKIDANLPEGIIGIPFSLPDFPYVNYGVKYKISGGDS